VAGTYAAYYDRFASAFLRSLPSGAQLDTPANHAAVVAWVGGEAGWDGTNTAVTHNNPLNIKTTSFTSYGIKVPTNNYITDAKTGKREAYGSFPTPEAGAQATAAYIQAAQHDHGYTPAIGALYNSDAVGFLNGIARSDWAEGHYGILSGTNRLLANLAYVRGSSPTGPVGPIGPGGPAPPDTPDAGGPYPAGTLAAVLGHDGTLTLDQVSLLGQTIADLTAKVPGWPGGGEKPEDVSSFLVDYVGHRYSDIPLNVSDPTKTFQGGTRAPGPESIVPTVLEAVSRLVVGVVAVLLVLAGLWLYARGKGQGQESGELVPQPVRIVP
jgi:hypothetical protein